MSLYLYLFEATNREKAAGTVATGTTIAMLIARRKAKRLVAARAKDRRRTYEIAKRRGTRQGTHTGRKQGAAQERQDYAKRGNMASQEAKRRKKAEEGMASAAKGQAKYK